MEVQDFMVLSASGNRPVDLDVDAWCLKVLQLSPAIDLCSFSPPLEMESASSVWFPSFLWMKQSGSLERVFYLEF
jgi:hypothetical protein